jgi:hypothetical protein
MNATFAKVMRMAHKLAANRYGQFLANMMVRRHGPANQLSAEARKKISAEMDQALLYLAYIGCYTLAMRNLPTEKALEFGGPRGKLAWMFKSYLGVDTNKCYQVLMQDPKDWKDAVMAMIAASRTILDFKDALTMCIEELLEGGEITPMDKEELMPIVNEMGERLGFGYPFSMIECALSQPTYHERIELFAREFFKMVNTDDDPAFIMMRISEDGIQESLVERLRDDDEGLASEDDDDDTGEMV